jgi:hypothetical protein
VSTCPRCEGELSSDSFICQRCADVLAVALRNAAANFDELEAAVARQTAISGDSGSGQRRRTLEGPVCPHCFHASCLPIRQSQLRAMWSEDPIPGETNHVSFGAMEDAWIVTNTATTWARLIEEETGRPIPPPAYREAVKGEPRRVLVQRATLKTYPPDYPDRCTYSDLPLGTCACHNPRRSHP